MTMTRRGFFRWLRDCFRDDAPSARLPGGGYQPVDDGRPRGEPPSSGSGAKKPPSCRTVGTAEASGVMPPIAMRVEVRLDNGQTVMTYAKIELHKDRLVFSTGPQLLPGPLQIDPRQP